MLLLLYTHEGVWSLFQLNFHWWRSWRWSQKNPLPLVFLRPYRPATAESHSSSHHRRTSAKLLSGWSSRAFAYFHTLIPSHPHMHTPTHPHTPHTCTPSPSLHLSRTLQISQESPEFSTMTRQLEPLRESSREHGSCSGWKLRTS